MAALLAGARLVLRQGVRLLPAITRAAPVMSAHVYLSFARSLSSSSRCLTVLAQEKGRSEAEPTPSSRPKAYVEDWSIRQLGQRLKTKGRTGKLNLLRTFEESCKMGVPTASQAWFFLRACGSYMPEVPLAERTKLADDIWNKLKELGVEFNVSHYNILLEVYLQNEHVFSPTEFLAKMEAANVEPDHGTFQGLLAAYCSEGDIDGASKILESMKNKNFPITEQVFNSLIKGHARAGDMESAMSVPSVMRTAGIEPQWSTHLALLNAYAENGDIEKIKEVLNNESINVPPRQLTSVIMTLVKSGNSQYVSEVLEHMPYCVAFAQDIINLSLALLTRGYQDAALETCKKINSWKPTNEASDMQAGDFFLRHCVNLNLPIDLLTKCADELQTAGMHTQPMHSLLRYALINANSDLVIKLLQTLRDQELSLKSRYFRPVLNHLLSSKDLPGLREMFLEMKHRGLSVELDTLSKCLSLITSGTKAGQAFLQDRDCVRDLKNVCVLAVLRELRMGNLNRMTGFISSFSIPALKDRVIAGALGSTYLQNKDVKELMKITGLLYKDGSDSRDSSASTEYIGHFLYYVISKISGAEAPTMVEHLRQYLHQLKEMGLTLGAKQYRGIQQTLEQEAPKLDEEVNKSLKSLIDSMTVPAENLAELESQLAELEKDNLSIEPVLSKMLGLLRRTKDLPKALELKAKYEDVFTSNIYTRLLTFCCEENNAVEALKLKKEIDQKGFNTILPTLKYIMLLKVLVENNLIEDAINILKEMQANDVPMDDSAEARLFQIFYHLALKGDNQTLNIFHEYSVMMGLINPYTKMCRPLVMVHLNKNDLSAAVNAIIECTEKYKCSPLLHEVMGTLMDNGETDLIKKLVDRLTDFLDEQRVLHELFFAFISTGKYSEAVKIAETPGLRANQEKIDWFTNRCVKRNEVDKLEKFVELSQKLFQCDRKDMYSKLLELYVKNNDLEKAKSTWYKMKRENFVPSMATLGRLQTLFQSNKQDINVHIPELENSVYLIRPPSAKIIDLCEEGKSAEAFAAFQEAKQRNVPLRSRAYRVLIDALVKDNLLKEVDEVEADAKKRVSAFSTGSNLLIEEQVRRDCLKDAIVTVQTMLENGRPLRRSSLYKLILALAHNGDVLGIEKIKELAERHELSAQVLPQVTGSCVVLAHLRKGNVEEGMSMLENMYLNAPILYVNAMFLFDQLMTNNMEEVLEKLSIMVERMANQFAIYSPVTYLFLNYVKAERLEEARQLLQRCSCIAEQRPLLARYILVGLNRKKAEEVTRVIELLSDPYYKRILYNYKMRGYAFRKDVDAAVALYEVTKAERIEPDELFLKLLATLLRHAEKPVPFSEPPETVEYYIEKQKNQLTQGKEMEME